MTLYTIHWTSKSLTGIWCRQCKPKCTIKIRKLKMKRIIKKEFWLSEFQLCFKPLRDLLGCCKGADWQIDCTDAQEIFTMSWISARTPSAQESFSLWVIGSMAPRQTWNNTKDSVDLLTEELQVTIQIYTFHIIICEHGTLTGQCEGNLCFGSFSTDKQDNEKCFPAFLHWYIYNGDKGNVDEKENGMQLVVSQ